MMARRDGRPTPEQLAEIAIMAAEAVRRFGHGARDRQHDSTVCRRRGREIPLVANRLTFN